MYLAKQRKKLERVFYCCTLNIIVVHWILQSLTCPGTSAKNEHRHKLSRYSGVCQSCGQPPAESCCCGNPFRFDRYYTGKNGGWYECYYDSLFCNVNDLIRCWKSRRQPGLFVFAKVITTPRLCGRFAKQVCSHHGRSVGRAAAWK